MSAERLYVIVQRIKHPWIPLLSGKKEPPVAVTTGEALGCVGFNWSYPKRHNFIVARSRGGALKKFHDEENWPDEKLLKEGQQYLGADC